MTNPEPLVSVITATYNRSDVLFYAISSVIASSYKNWELLVVGDACTDDTKEVVASFNHERIKFFNLSENFGDQGGPNNEGFKHAKGEYIAYLSHDDIWLPDHLESAVNHFKTTQADMVTTLGIRFINEQERSLIGAMPNERFFPFIGIPASLWICTRKLIEEIGPWCHPHECRLPPSQHLLLNAWKMGKNIQALPKATAIVIPAGTRKGSYISNEINESKECFHRLQREPHFVENELTKVCRTQLFGSGKLLVIPHLKKGLFNLIRRISFRCGIPPMKLAYLKYFRKKGIFINQWRKKCGLPAIK